MGASDIEKHLDVLEATISAMQKETFVKHNPTSVDWNISKLEIFQALFLDTCHAFYALDFSEKLSFGLFELSFLQNN